MVAVFVAEGDLVDALAALLGAVMDHPRRIAGVGQAAGKARRQPEPIVDLAQQNHSAVRADLRRVERQPHRQPRVETQTQLCATLRHRGDLRESPCNLFT